jgi:hypothetical protein
MKIDQFFLKGRSPTKIDRFLKGQVALANEPIPLNGRLLVKINQF